MKEPTDLGIKFRDRIITRYPPMEEADMPGNYDIISVDYRSMERASFYWRQIGR